MKRFLAYLSQHWGSLFIGLCCVVLQSICNFLLIPLARSLPDVFTHLSARSLGELTGAVVLVYAFKGLFGYGQMYVLGSVGLRIAADLRRDLYQRLIYQPLSSLQRYRSGDLVARLVNDTQLLKDAMVSAVAEGLPSLIMIISLLGYIFWLNWRLALVTLLGVPLMMGAIALFSQRLQKTSDSVQSRLADLFSMTQETLTNHLVIKAFSLERRQADHFHQQNEANIDAQRSSLKTLSLQQPVVGLLQVIAIAGVIWYGGWEILQGRLTTGDLLAFATALGLTVDPVILLTKSIGAASVAKASAQRVGEVLRFEIETPQLSSSPVVPTGAIALEGVSFSYAGAGKPALQSINLTISPGQTIALVGPSGGGKSTLASLLLRFYEPQKGQIAWGEKSASTLSPSEWRSLISLVPQEGLLFNLTIRENIAIARPEATDEEIQLVARHAHAHDFIIALPNGYDTHLGATGINLSGGQKQRLAIARALLTNPKLLILDEATSALDLEAEALVQEAIENTTGDRMTVIIAHRLAAIKNVDHIFVLDEGNLVEQGTHAQLIAKDGLYARLYRYQEVSTP